MSRMSWASLGRILLGRLGGMLAVLSLVSVLVFLLTRLAAGDPIAVLLGDQASLEDIAQARQRYGLDQPLISQFILWLGEVLKGNLGQSIFCKCRSRKCCGIAWSLRHGLPFCPSLWPC